MATYASLSASDKAQIALADKHYRTFLRKFRRVIRDVDFVVAEAFVVAVADPLINSLDVGQVIPNASDFAGATDFTKAQFQAMQVFVRGFKTTLDTNQSGLTKAIGINAE